jgi:hypothetical protein
MISPGRGLILGAAALLVLFCGGESVDGSRETSQGGSGGIGLGGTGGLRPDGSGGTAVGSDAFPDASADDSSWGGGLDLGDARPMSYDGPLYEGGGSCAPEGGEFERRTCCEGNPCLGNCELHDGTWQCFCMAVAGGCEQYGMVCCRGVGCTTDCPGGLP